MTREQFIRTCRLLRPEYEIVDGCVCLINAPRELQQALDATPELKQEIFTYGSKIVIKESAKQEAKSFPQIESLLPPVVKREIVKPETRKEPFSFDTHMKAYEEMQRKGTRKLEIILSALGDEKARDYVKLYFASDSVKWSVKKFKLHIQSNIAKWTELRQKYGDGGFANYSESIMTNELILRTLDELDNKLMEIDKLAA